MKHFFSLQTLKIIILITAAIFLLLFFITSAMRISYPFALEWVEGGMLIHVHRILENQPLYTAASAEWIPYTYTPLFYYISAGVSKLTGEGFLPLRLVSLFASTGTFILIGAFVYKETKSVYFGFISAALYAATFEAVAQWFDLGRVDALFLFFLLLGIYLLRFRQSIPGIIFSAVFLSASLFTKQSALIVIIPLFIYAVIYFKGLKRILPPLVFILISLSVIIIFEQNSGGTFLQRTFFLSGRISFEPVPHISFWVKHLFGTLPIIAAYTIIGMILLYKNGEKEKFAFYALFLSGALLVSLLSAVKLGAWRSVLMPAYAALIITAGISLMYLLPELARKISTKGVYLFSSAGKERNHYTPFLLALLFLFQFFSLNYNPMKAIPDEQDEKAGNELITMIKETEGSVYIPEHNYLALLAGKKTYANGIALIALSRTGFGETVENIHMQLAEKIGKGEITAVITSHLLNGGPFVNKLTYKGAFFSDSPYFFTITGLPTRPNFVYLRK